MEMEEEEQSHHNQQQQQNEEEDDDNNSAAGASVDAAAASGGGGDGPSRLEAPSGSSPAAVLPSPSHSGHSAAAALVGVKEVKILETAEDICDRRDQVLGRYSAFKTEVKMKREKLEDSRRFQYFKRDADELESWIYEKLQAASSDEGFKDVSNLQAKIQKHQVS